MDESYSIGEVFSKTVTFDEASSKDFATRVGDYSPLHHDVEFSKTTRFGGLIVSGTQYSALMMGMVASFLTERGAGLGLEFDFKFKKAIMVGATVTMEWEIISISPNETLKGDIVTLQGFLIDESGNICVTASSRSLCLSKQAILAV